jgi:hypothetical protein
MGRRSVITITNAKAKGKKWKNREKIKNRVCTKYEFGIGRYTKDEDRSNNKENRLKAKIWSRISRETERETRNENERKAIGRDG